MTPRERLKEILLDKSVKTGDFTLASGQKSDLYVDCRTTTIHSEGAILVGQLGWECLSQKLAQLSLTPQAIGGMTLGADPIALAIGMESVRSGSAHPVQTFVVRKEPKGHGRGKQVEGNFHPGDLVVAIEDTVTTGGSVLRAIEVIERAGGTVGLVFILVDREEGAVEKIQAAGYEVVCLFTKSELLSGR